MKATGIVRRVDDLGRVAIPKEIRRTMQIRDGDPLELWVDTSNKDHPILCLAKYTSDSGDEVLNDFIARLEGIKKDWYNDFNNKDNGETANKISVIINLLKDNKDKFDF